jgi:hypothetical protein
MALAEYESLVYLWSVLEGKRDPMLRVVRPLDLYNRYNAILTEGIDNSIEIFRLMRRVGRRKNPGSQYISIIACIGRWLRSVHSSSARDLGGLKKHPSFLEDLMQLRAEAADLRDIYGTSVDTIMRHIDSLEGLMREADEGKRSVVIEGFEVRNFITDGSSIWFLDPGRITSGTIYEDLARLIASLSLLYWGGFGFLLPYRNEPLLTQTFLDEYRQKSRAVEPMLLSSYLVKQYIRLWINGLQVLQFKKLWRPVCIVARTIYVDRFFSERIEEALGAFCDHGRQA